MARLPVSIDTTVRELAGDELSNWIREAIAEKLEREQQQDLSAWSYEFHELQQIVESNARSIQSLADRISELTHDIEDLKDLSREAIEERAELRRATLRIANLLSSSDENRPTILRKLNTIESKVDQILGQQHWHSFNISPTGKWDFIDD